MRQNAVPPSFSAAMASNRPPPRMSPRTIAPLKLRSGTTAHSSILQTQDISPAVPNHSNGWAEPPLRAPQPSFMDHSLERGGVLEQMAPLGSFPTAKVKARAKKDPLRKMVQARHLEGTLVDDARASPDLAYFAQNGSQMQSEEAGVVETLESGSLVDSEIQMVEQRTKSLSATPRSNAANESPLRSRRPFISLASPDEYKSPLHTTPPMRVPQLVYDGLKKAIKAAQQNERPDIEQNLLRVFRLGMHDPEFVTLLKFAMTNDSLDERGSAINRKLKELRKKLRETGRWLTRPPTAGKSAIVVHFLGRTFSNSFTCRRRRRTSGTRR